MKGINGTNKSKQNLSQHDSSKINLKIHYNSQERKFLEVYAQTSFNLKWILKRLFNLASPPSNCGLSFTAP